MTEAVNPEQTAEAAAPAAPLTPREKLIEKYNKLFAQRKDIDEKLAAIVAEVTAIDTQASVGVGSVVLFSKGKGEAAVQVEGIVIGARDNEDGTKDLKISYGTGFDADVVVLKASKVKVKPAEQAATE